MQRTRWLRGLRADWHENFGLVGLALLVGSSAGLVAVGFRYLIFGIQNLALFGRLSVVASDPTDNTLGAWIVVVPAAGGLVVGLLTFSLATEARGHGVPEVMEAIAIHGGHLRARLIGIKSLASAITIGTGGSAGREGPIVQIGSALGATVGRLFGLQPYMTKVLVACGATAGIAATFNTPIGGVLFSIELILLELKTRSFIPLVIASVLGTVVSRFFLGRHPAFIVPDYEFEHGVELFFYMGLGLLAGLAAVAMIALLYKTEDVFTNLALPPYLRPALGGLALGVIALRFPQILGVGYETVIAVLQENYAGPMLVGLMALKIVAVSLTLGSGGSGGVFAPSLFVGATLGGSFGAFVHHLFPAYTASPGAYALVGMAAVFAGAGRATLTGIIILFEMTQDYHIILPLMFACVVSDLVAWTMHPESIYTEKLKRRGVEVVLDIGVEEMARVRVGEVMDHRVETVEERASIREAYDKTLATGRKALAVVNGDGELTGIVTHLELSRAFKRDETERSMYQFATRELITAYPNQNLSEVIDHFYEIEQVPVVDPRDPKRLLGMLRRLDLLKAHGKKVIS